MADAEEEAVLARIEPDLDNARAALAWFIGRGSAEEAQRLAAALWLFWDRRGFFAEGRRWLTAALSLPGAAETPPRVRAAAVSRLGFLCLDLADYGAARCWLEEGLEVRRRLGDRVNVAWALHGLGLVAEAQGDLARGRAHREEALAILRGLDEPEALAIALSSLGNMLHAEGDLAGARRLHEESLEIRLAAGAPRAIAYQCLNLGDLARSEGRPGEATRLLEESLRRFRGLGDRVGAAYALHMLGRVAQAAGDAAAAADYQVESLRLRREIGDRRGMAECVEAIAAAASTGQPVAAARLLGAADAIRRSINAPLPDHERASVEQASRTAQAALGAEGFAVARNGGRIAPAQAAIDDALAVGASVAATPAAPVSTPSRVVADGLTRREREVLALLAQGQSNQAIADALFVSLPTVKAHVTSILAKLGANSRAAAVSQAHRRGLT